MVNHHHHHHQASSRNCCVHMVPRPVDMSCGRGAWDDCSSSFQLSVGVQGLHTCGMVQEAGLAVLPLAVEECLTSEGTRQCCTHSSLPPHPVVLPSEVSSGTLMAKEDPQHTRDGRGGGGAGG